MSDVQPRKKIDAPIRVKGDWIPDDFITAHNLAYPMSRGKKLSLIGGALFMAVSGSSTILFLEPPSSYFTGSFIIIMALIILCAPIWYPPFMARQQVKQAFKESKGCDVQIVESGFRWLHLSDPVTREWEKWYAAIVHEEVIVLFEHKRKFEVVPRRLFEKDEEYELAVGVVKDKIRSTIDMHGK